MLAICSADEPVVFQAPKTSSKAEKKDSKGKKILELKLDPLKSKLDPSQRQPKMGLLKHPLDPKVAILKLWVTSEERANPQLSSGMLAFNLNKPIFLASFILHSEFASGRDASADSITEADPGISTPSTDPNVLVDKTQYVSEGLDTVLTESKTGKGAITIARHIEEANSDEA
ncbi:hypothetical protein Tco_1229014 [Tanacetum coccineum]